LEQKVEEELDGKKKELPASLKGKTYLVEWDGAERTVVYDGGGKPSSEEKDLVVEAEYDVGKHSDAALFIPDRPLRVGERFDANEATIRTLLGMDEGDKITIEKASFTFTGTKQEGAKAFGLFDLVLIVAHWPKETPDMRLRFETTGKLSVDVETSWTRDFSMEGPISLKIEDKAARVTTEGTGSIKQSGVAKYL
jgi:hypothetical protein